MTGLIKLNYSNCMKEFAGDNGLTREELEALQTKITEGHNSILMQKSSGKLGFMELPYKTDLARQIKAAAKKLSPRFENFVVIGIGGSALGNIALQQALRHPFWLRTD